MSARGACALGPVLLVALTAATPTAAAAWRPDTRAAVKYIHQRKGHIAFAVRADKGLWGYHRTEGVHSAVDLLPTSTVKVEYTYTPVPEPATATQSGESR